jgi:hypothetical protein
MADEVSKKDLQALERNFNKQIADVKKLLEEQKKEFNKGLDEENKITVTVRQELGKRIDGIESKFQTRDDELQTAINALARAIGDLANKAKK